MTPKKEIRASLDALAVIGAEHERKRKMKCYGYENSELIDHESEVLKCFGCGEEFDTLAKCENDGEDFLIGLCDECINDIDYVDGGRWYACNGWNGIIERRREYE